MDSIFKLWAYLSSLSASGWEIKRWNDEIGRKRQDARGEPTEADYAAAESDEPLENQNYLTWPSFCATA